MTDSDNNFAKLKYATEWQVEIGKVLQSFDPVLRPLEDMAKHGITMATVLLGISASVVGGFAAGSLGMSPTNLLILGAWLSFLAAATAGSVQLHRISLFRESIRKFCHVLLGKESSVAERESAMSVMTTPQKKALTIEYWALGVGTALLILWAVVRTAGQYAR